MYHWIKQKLYYAKSAREHSLKKESISDKPQAYSQEQDKQPTSQSQSLPVRNADTSTLNSYQKRLKTLSRSIYSGIQGQIYD